MPKMALVMIVKASSDDEAVHLKRCLESVSQYVDGIFLNLNVKRGQKVSKSVLELCETYKVNYIETRWRDNFAEARNANLAQVPSEYTHWIWLDCDDTVDHPEKIRKIAEATPNHDAIFSDYIYDRDEEGNPTTVHMVARLLKNNGSHVWKGRIHETLVETRSVQQGMTKDFVVVHHADKDRQDKSFARNIELLEKQLKDERKEPDPRTIYYLARAYADSYQPEKAKPLLNSFLILSGWDQERSAAETRLGRIHQDEGDTTAAKQHYMLAIGEDPDNPEPRVSMGALELQLKQYHKARLWLEGVILMEKNLTTLERNPMNYTFRTYWLLSEVYLGMGGKWLEKALEMGKKALSYRKKDKDIRKFVGIIEKVVRDKSLTTKMLEIVQVLKKNKEVDKIKLLAQAAPKQIEDNPIIVKLREQEPYTWPEKSVVILTGDGMIEEWGPWSLKQGIGGSEEAVIRLSKHLSGLGYKVVVFGKPGNNAGTDENGVMWRNFWEVNLEDKFDIFIAWRAPFIFDRKIDARKSYLWLHDVMEPGEFTPTRIENFTKCIVLSKYHRSLFPMIPDEKIMLSANGIDSEEFDNPYPVERIKTGFNEEQVKPQSIRYIGRDPHKMIWASSHVRGLAYLYRIWSDVKKAVPDATLDVYYGRESYDAVHKGNPERMKWMDDMIATAKELDGVTDHGKVGQDEIVRHIFESGIWPYPCPFPEIYCVSAVKAQAGGAIPVASNYAALDETVQFGYKQDFGEFSDEDLQKYKEALIWWLQHPEEQEKVRSTMMKEMRKHTWLRVAHQWINEFEL